MSEDARREYETITRVNQQMEHEKHVAWLEQRIESLNWENRYLRKEIGRLKEQLAKEST